MHIDNNSTYCTSFVKNIHVTPSIRMTSYKIRTIANEISSKIGILRKSTSRFSVNDLKYRVYQNDVNSSKMSLNHKV